MKDNLQQVLQRFCIVIWQHTSEGVVELSMMVLKLSSAGAGCPI